MIFSVIDRVENIMEKGENAGYQHFLLFAQCFKKASFPDMPKEVIVWEWVKVMNTPSTSLPNICSLLLSIDQESPVQISSKGNNSVKTQ